MQQQLYRVVFDSSEIDHKQRRRAKRNMARQFNLNRKKIERLFADKPAVIKRDITFERAVRLKVAIEQAGGVCRIREMKAGTISTTTRPGVPVLDKTAKRPTTDYSQSITWVDLAWADASARSEHSQSARRPDDRPKIYRQPHDRRKNKDRRASIRLQQDRRSGQDRRSENQAWRSHL